MSRITLRNITLIWLAWSIIIIGFMHYIGLRFKPDRPDNALVWTANETTRRSNIAKPYLLDPFLNSQVAWDSEFYLSIATVGYEDPDVSMVESRDGTSPESYSKSYAFFPFYPYLMKLVRLPFTLFLNPIAASTMAGIIVSLLGTLAAVLAIYDIAREELGEDGASRTIFLMLIFPSAFFFSTIYTEGLFVGLAFSSLALMRRKQLIAAAILAALATWTRSIGGALMLPLLISCWLQYREAGNKQILLRSSIVSFLPVLAYAIWRFTNGTQFDFVQDNWFGNKLFQFDVTVDAWRQILERAQNYPETRFFLVMTVFFIVLALLSCCINFRRYPLLAIFGLIALLIPLTSGWTGTQSSFRYVLAVPTLWIMLGQWSRNIIFERSWTLFSILLLAINAYLFSFDFWAA